MHVCKFGMYRAGIESMKALAALTDGSLPNQDRALQAGAPPLLSQVSEAAMQSGPSADAETACKHCFINIALSVVTISKSCCTRIWQQCSCCVTHVMGSVRIQKPISIQPTASWLVSCHACAPAATSETPKQRVF